MSQIRLYELTNNFSELFEQYEDIIAWQPETDADGKPIDANGNEIENIEAYKNNMLQAWFDTLEGIEGEFEQKAADIAVYVKGIEGEIKVLQAEKKSLDARINQRKNSIERLKKYLVANMQSIGRSKIDVPAAVLSLRKNAPSLVVDDEMSFIYWAQEHHDELLKYSMPDIKKKETKDLVKAGEKIPYVHMEQSISLIIK